MIAEALAAQTTLLIVLLVGLYLFDAFDSSPKFRRKVLTAVGALALVSAVAHIWAEALS